MGRYIKRFGRVGHALGPSEERGFEMWAGYDLIGMEEDLSDLGLIRVDDWSEERLAAHGVISFTRVEKGDGVTYQKLGIAPKA